MAIEACLCICFLSLLSIPTLFFGSCVCCIYFYLNMCRLAGLYVSVGYYIDYWVCLCLDYRKSGSWMVLFGGIDYVIKAMKF